MWNSPRAFPHIPLSLSLGISHQNLLSFQCSYITVATVCSQRTLFHYLISQQQLPAQKIPAARNYHSSCFLLFRNPWALPVSKPLSPASHQYALENGFFNPATGPSPPPHPIIQAWRSSWAPPFPLFLTPAHLPSSVQSDPFFRLILGLWGRCGFTSFGSAIAVEAAAAIL